MSTLSLATLGFLSTGESSSAGYVPIEELEVILASSTMEAELKDDTLDASLSSSIDIEIEQAEIETNGQ